MASDALVDEVAVGSGTEARRQTDKCVEGGAGMAPSIPATDELVEIPVEMRLTHTVKGAQAPALQIGKHPMDPGQHDVSRHAANHLALMLVLLVLLRAAIGLQPVADDRGTRRNDVTDKAGNAR